MPEVIWRGQMFDECDPNDRRRRDCYGHRYRPRRRYGGCYAPSRRDACQTVHVRLWVNAATGTVPPAGSPTYDGLADWRVLEDRRLLIVPGSAMVGSTGIGASTTTTYALIVDDKTGQPMVWFKVTDWDFITCPISPTTQEVDWIALEVYHA
jgi:hypothetical protein